MFILAGKFKCHFRKTLSNFKIILVSKALKDMSIGILKKENNKQALGLRRVLSIMLLNLCIVLLHTAAPDVPDSSAA